MRRGDVTVDEQEWLAERFETHRTHLRAVAYRMLGSPSEAEDALQEAWLRLSRTDTSAIENLGGWLTTVVARVCLNMLQARKTRREQPLVHVPDPILSREDGIEPEQEALLADSVGLACSLRPTRSESAGSSATSCCLARARSSWMSARSSSTRTETS
jgi:RNA polymerase sigma-70 factor (ECF subfamily)